MHGRTSLIFFNNLDSEAVIEPLPSCVTVERPARYEPVTCGSYVQARLKSMRDNYEPREGGTNGERGVAEPEGANEAVVEAQL